MEPGNTIADNGLRRAKNLALVLTRFEQARKLEAAGQLDPALRGYREVEALDSEFQPSREARVNIERRISERDYLRAVSDASSAVERQEFSRAKDALAVAKKLRPNASQVREIAMRMRAAMQRDQLDNLRRQAGVHERNEDWAASLRVYDDVLVIDARAKFAVRGKLRAERYLTLNRQLDHYLSQPDRLQPSESLAHARGIIRTVARLGNVGPKLSAKTQRLSALVAEANGPQPVILRSDQKTRVMVHRVAQFGRFKEHRLKLRPGTYTAIGSRPGYHDVWVKFHVKPSRDGIVVVVRCRERI